MSTKNIRVRLIGWSNTTHWTQYLLFSHSFIFTCSICVIIARGSKSVAIPANKNGSEYVVSSTFASWILPQCAFTLHPTLHSTTLGKIWSSIMICIPHVHNHSAQPQYSILIILSSSHAFQIRMKEPKGWLCWNTILLRRLETIKVNIKSKNLLGKLTKSKNVRSGDTILLFP